MCAHAAPHMSAILAQKLPKLYNDIILYARGVPARRRKVRRSSSRRLSVL